MLQRPQLQVIWLRRRPEPVLFITHDDRQGWSEVQRKQIWAKMVLQRDDNISPPSKDSKGNQKSCIQNGDGRLPHCWPARPVHLQFHHLGGQCHLRSGQAHRDRSHKNIAIGKTSQAIATFHNIWNLDTYLIFVLFFTQPQFKAWKFYTWNCVNSRQKLPRDKTA